MPKPNIVYLHSHDTGRYIQPYGHAVPTPNVQRLAEQGVLFRQTFCCAPTCSASRAALLTGQCPHSAGINGLAHRGFPVPDNRHVLVPYLTKNGYHTALFGMTHIMKDKAAIGYHEIASVKPGARAAAPAAAEWLRKQPRQPFFLDVGFTETHRVFPEPGPAEDPRYCLPPPYFPDTPETRRDMAAFKTSARIMDEGIGLVLKALDDAGLADNT
ncbi:MAG: sulfatase, partial [Planctomycetes bacterium]|nr:sulfatase [Planctomycetota bacterium]